MNNNIYEQHGSRTTNQRIQSVTLRCKIRSVVCSYPTGPASLLGCSSTGCSVRKRKITVCWFFWDPGITVSFFDLSVLLVTAQLSLFWIVIWGSCPETTKRCEVMIRMNNNFSNMSVFVDGTERARSFLSMSYQVLESFQTGHRRQPKKIQQLEL